jgi:hypothetical protein
MFFYTGDPAEDGPGTIFTGVFGTSALSTGRQLFVSVEAPGIGETAPSGAMSLTLFSEAVDDSTGPRAEFFYNGGSAKLPALRLAGAVVAQFDSLGSSTSPTVGIGSNYDDGIYSPADSQLAMTVAGTQELFLSATTFQVPNVFNSTDAGAANVVVTAAGSLRRNASALKYKPDWRYAPNLATRQLPPAIVWDEGNRLGFAAEHVAHIVPEAAAFEQYHDDSLIAILRDKVERIEEHLGLDNT